MIHLLQRLVCLLFGHRILIETTTIYHVSGQSETWKKRRCATCGHEETP